MSQKFSFTYYPYPYNDPATGVLVDTFRPTIPVSIKKGTKQSSFFQALIDSGSDRNLFPAAFGEMVGLKIDDGKHAPINGIGGIMIDSYTHEVELVVGKYEFLVPVDFSYQQEVPLLGRRGFFDQFRSIEFRERQKKVEFLVS